MSAPRDSPFSGQATLVSSDNDGDVTLKVEGAPSGDQLICLSLEDAQQVAYALMTVCAGQGPSLVRVHLGKRERVD